MKNNINEHLQHFISGDFAGLSIITRASEQKLFQSFFNILLFFKISNKSA